MLKQSNGFSQNLSYDDLAPKIQTIIKCTGSKCMGYFLDNLVSHFLAGIGC